MVMFMSACEEDANYKEFDYPVPVPSGLTPAIDYEGAIVTITGKDFGTLPKAVKVSFGGVQATDIVSCTDNKIEVKVPVGGASGDVSLQIWTHVVDKVGEFTVIPAPKITSISSSNQDPSVASPGDIVTITGTGFGTDATKTSVLFGETVAEIKSIADDKIEVITPDNFEPGTVYLQIGGIKIAAGMITKPIGRDYIYFPFDEGAGPIATDAWSGIKATLHAANWTDDGQTNKALSLDGATGYVSFPNITGMLKSFTISFWMNPTSHSNWARLFDFGSGEGNFLFFTPQNSINGMPRFAIKNGGAEQLFDGTSKIPVNKWTHVAITFDWDKEAKKGIGSMYINGVAGGSNNNMTINPSMLPDATQSYIGKAQFPDPLYNGKVDEFKIHTVALTAAEVKAEFDNSNKDPQGPSEKGDVTDKYLKNYGPGITNSYFDGGRWGTPAEWIVNDAIKSREKDGVKYGGWAKDTFDDKAGTVGSGVICCETHAGGATTITDGVIYQTAKLPAGTYKLESKIFTELKDDSPCYMVVTKGEGLPSTSNVATALANQKFSTPSTSVPEKINTKHETLTCEFTLSSEQTVSIGFIINMSFKNYFTIGAVTLTRL